MMTQNVRDIISITIVRACKAHVFCLSLFVFSSTYRYLACKISNYNMIHTIIKHFQASTYNLARIEFDDLNLKFLK